MCLVIIILQGPLGLSAQPSIGLGGFGWGMGGGGYGVGMGGLGCNGLVAGVVPWCTVTPVGSIGGGVPMIAAQPVHMGAMRMATGMGYPQYTSQNVVINNARPAYPYPHHQVDHAMGGQGYIATPVGGGGYSWYANPPSYGYHRRESPFLLPSSPKPQGNK